MTQIERRQARIRRIYERLGESRETRDEENACTPDVHHHIGKSQNYPEHIGLFLQQHAGDPAVKVKSYLMSCS